LAASAVDHEQRKTVTVLFSDVTGSTALGEQLEPESLRRMLSRFFDAARSVVESHGGTVEKFIGDAVMAVFGVPVVHEDDALRALRAALDLMSALQPLNVDLQREYGATLQIRIGVNTGDVVTGTSERLATGDAVNIAARLEQLATPGEIYVGEMTAQLAGTLATLEELEPAMLKGKTAPTRVFRLLATNLVERPARATPMVGRQRQLDMLRGAFAQAVADGSCVLFTVLGVAGVGKSRLVAEFLHGVDATAVRGRCLSYGNGVGLWPAVEIVRQLQASESAGEISALLARDEAVAAAIRTLVGSDVGGSSSTEVAWGMRRLFEETARVHPLVIVFDDLHWAEEALFEVIEHLVTLSRDAPILVVAMARPELRERRESWGVGALNASSVLLEPLGVDETSDLVEGLSTSLDATARAKVKAAAAGNPLFAEEMVALVEASDGGEVRVPPTIQALLAARLDQLEPADVRVLERGSVEGQSFHRRALTALGADDADTARRLLGLVRKDLLRPDPPTLDRDDAFRFRHLLLRDAAYDRLPKSTRAELHERFARWLEEQGSDVVDRDSLVGYHLEQAYRYLAELGPVDDDARRLRSDAAQRLDAAGRRQLARSDLAGAIDLLERASALDPRDTPDVSLELGIAAAILMCGRPADAAARARAAAEAAARVGDTIGAQQANLSRVWYDLTLGNSSVGEFQRLLETALPAFESAGDNDALAWGWWAAVQLAHLECRFADGLEAATNVQRYAKLSADPFLNTHIESFSAHIALGPTPIPRALEILDEARRRSAGYDPWMDAMRSTLFANLGRFDEARAMLEETIAAFLDRGMTLAAAISGQNAWCIAMAAGDVEAAAAAGRESCAQLELLGERTWLSTNAAQLAESLHVLGRDEEAQEWVERALDLGDPQDAVTQAQARMVRAMVNARRGDADSARRDVDDVLRITAKMQAPQLQGEAALNAAHVFVMIGDRPAATEQLRYALELFTAKESLVYAARAADALAAMTTAP
jgi:class 3 adenylate cyclase/tetratricopeptide (TPR) repeat protein